MKRFQNILLIFDGQSREKSTLIRAITLARTNKARLTVANVIKELPKYSKLKGKLPTQEELHRRIIDHRRKQLEQALSAYRQEDVPMTTRVFIGTPFREIIKAVQQDEYDLVLLTAEESKGLEKVFYGSTAMHLLRKSPCPVMVLKPDAPAKYRTVLAAVDMEPFDDDKKELNDKIMQLATSMTFREGGELHILHAWEVAGEHLLRSGFSGVPSEEVDILVYETENLHKGWLNNLVTRHGLKESQARIHLLYGDAGEAIPGIAREINADLIVMGTVGRTGVQGLFMGNTAEKVLSQVNCSVLAVKPEGFETPVTVE